MTNEHANDQLEQPLIQHLIELRSRLIKSLCAIALIFIGLFPFANRIYDFVAYPLQKFLPDNSQMIAIDVASPFLTPFKLSLLLSLFLSMPFLLYQVWAFVAPALYKNEKRIAMPIFISSVVLFYAGVSFAYFVVFPLVFGFFTSIGPSSVAMMTDISSYLSFVIKIFFAFGVAFEIPVATVLLISAGVISPKGLAEKRPYVIVACFVLGMFLTPPDVLSQLLLAIPMWGLFELGLIFGYIIKKQDAKSDTQEEAVD